MFKQLVCGTHFVFNHNLFTNPRRFFGWWLIAIVLTFVLQGESLAATRVQQKRPTGRPRVVGNKPSTIVQSTPTSADDGLPEDPAIVAESRKIEARRSEERQKAERELLAKNNPAQTRSDNLWREFRQTFPLHSQVIALSDAEPDGSRTLIVSEPPPHVRLGNILAMVGGELLLNHQVKRQLIGYDGWVKDVVMSVRGKDEELQAMLSRLNQRLFFTSYKSYTLKLPVKISAKPFDLNLTVTPEEMKRWVMEEGEQFFPVEGGRAETLASLAAEQSSGVYVSRRRGLIGWWIPKRRNVHECRIPARQFTLDADIIIGAIANPAGIFVVGRERMVPVEILPPLRFETLALLADVQDGQKGSLAQSYERSHPFAGPIGDGRDWAPILLSPQLRDTEYGSLLNITDQLLKGWSNSGQTKYHNFPYPEPGKYPFPKPLWEHLDIGSKGQALTYNWNTKGTGYTVNFGPVTMMALNRSGALPVSYIPDGMGRAEPTVIRAEDTGYDYFSRQSDPNLVRVVQYAAIYQIFSAFNVARSPEVIPADSYPDQLLETLTNKLYADLRMASETELNALAQQLASLIFNRKSLDEQLSRFAAKETEEVKKEIDEGLRKRGVGPGSREYNEKFEYVLNEFKKEQARRVEGAVAKYYQEEVEHIRRQLEAVKLNHPAKNASEEMLRKEVLSHFASLRRTPQHYAETIGLRAEGWIHTPVVVVSWNKGEALIGGHNLDARVSKIVTDRRIQPGQVDIDAKGNLLVNPADLPRARGLARNFERNDLMRKLVRAAQEPDPSKFYSVQVEMQNALKRAEVVPLRPRETALYPSSPPPPVKPPTNKPPMLAGEPPPAGGAGWGGGGRNSKPIPVAVERRDPNAILIKLGDDSRYHLEYSHADGREAFRLEALAHEDVVDVAARQAIRRAKPGEPVVIEFDGLPEHKALATLRTMEIRMGERGQAVEIIGYLPGNKNLRTTDAALSKQYDFSRAKIEVSGVKDLPTGQLQQNVSLNVPVFNSTSKWVSFTSEIVFNKLTPRNVVTAVRERVSRAFNGIATRWSRLAQSRRFQADVSDYNKELTRAVKKIKARTKLDFDVKVDFTVGEEQGLRDIYIGDKGPTYGEFASGPTAGQSE